MWDRAPGHVFDTNTHTKRFSLLGPWPQDKLALLSRVYQQIHLSVLEFERGTHIILQVTECKWTVCGRNLFCSTKQLCYSSHQRILLNDWPTSGSWWTAGILKTVDSCISQFVYTQLLFVWAVKYSLCIQYTFCARI